MHRRDTGLPDWRHGTRRADPPIMTSIPQLQLEHVRGGFESQAASLYRKLQALSDKRFWEDHWREQAEDERRRANEY